MTFDKFEIQGSTPTTTRRWFHLSAIWVRRARLYSGLILLAFVFMHLTNHALGIFGLTVMEMVQVVRVSIWRSWPGTFILCAAVIVHMVLGLKRLIERRTWRLPIDEVVKIVLALLIPTLLANHIIANGYLPRVFTMDTSYSAALYHMWPNRALQNTLMLTVVWTHGILGLHHVLRAQYWYPNWRAVFLSVAIALPLLALTGFMVAGREAAQLADPAAARSNEIRVLYAAIRDAVHLAIYVGLIALFVILIALTFYRRYQKKISIDYQGLKIAKFVSGATLLAVSRANGIAHASICGGQGRCGTCRVLVLRGEEHLGPRNSIETNLLNRISAPAGVRLACQIRPREDLSVRLLVPPDKSLQRFDWEDEGLIWGQRRTATILIARLQELSGEFKPNRPEQLVWLAELFHSESCQAIEANNGKVGMQTNDSILAIFGLSQTHRQGARAAMRSAESILNGVTSMHKKLGFSDLQSFSARIGIHTGTVTMGRISLNDQHSITTAIGQTVFVASELERHATELGVPCLVSKKTIMTSGGQGRMQMPIAVNVPNRDRPLTAFALNFKEPNTEIGGNTPKGTFSPANN